MSEGSTDRTRRPITSAYVKDVLTQRLGWDTRVTCLGHVQRGGAPSAYDRCLGSRLGSEAVLALLDSTEEIPARILGIRWNQLVKVDLDYAVTKVTLNKEGRGVPSFFSFVHLFQRCPSTEWRAGERP